METGTIFKLILGTAMLCGTLYYLAIKFRKAGRALRSKVSNPNVQQKTQEDFECDLELMVKGGYQSRKEIEGYAVEAIEQHNLSLDKTMAKIESCFAEHADAQKTWAKATDNDSLTVVFDTLKAKGIWCVENPSNTPSDASFVAIEEALEIRPTPKGVCYFHEQDVERAIETGQLYLAYELTKEHNSHSELEAIAKEIVQTLTQHGFYAKWNGSTEQRILIENFNWQKRRPELK